MRSFTHTGNAAREELREDVLGRLGTAVETLLDSGFVYSDLSVERIADVAGLSRSSFYRYVADKGELLQWLARDIDSEASAAAGEFWNLPAEASRSELADTLEQFIRVCWEHRLLRKAVFGATAYDPVIRADHDATLAAFTTFLAHHVHTGQAAGWIDPELDPDHTAAWFVQMADRGLVTIVGPSDPDDLAEVSSSLLGILWGTLYDGFRDPAGGILDRERSR